MSAGLRTWIDLYYDAGWPGLIPLPPGRKNPPGPGLTGAEGHDLGRDDVWARVSDSPDANLGLRMPADVIGIDVDVYDSKGGDRTMQWLQVGPPGDPGDALGELPPTWSVTSRDDGSGIRFYRVPAGKNWESAIGDGVEIIQRAHRYAVCEPSVHPNGRTYRWHKENGAQGLSVPPRVADLPDLPESWVAYLDAGGSTRHVHAARQATTKQEVLDHVSAFLPGPPCSCVAGARDQAMSAARREQGGAHDALLGPIMRLVRMGTNGICTGADLALMEARREYIALDTVSHPHDFYMMVAGAVGAAKAADPWMCADRLPDWPGVTTMDGIVEALNEKHANPLGYVQFDKDFWHPGPSVYYIPQMLIENQVGAIYSAGGLGKSLLMQDIAIGLTHRGRVFGVDVEKQPVLYIDRENGLRTLSKRFRSMGYFDIDIPLLHYSLLGQWPPLDSEAGAEALVAEMERTGARLVVLDTLSKVVRGEENSNDTWKGLHAHTMVAVKSVGGTVLELDHTGKDPDRGQRGGSSKFDNADVIWHLSAADDFVKLVNKKDRDDDYDTVIYLERHTVPRLEHRFVETLPAAAAEEMRRLARIDDLVADLDALGVDNSAGRGECTQRLKDAGRTSIPRELRDAVRVRKERDNISVR